MSSPLLRTILLCLILALVSSGILASELAETAPPERQVTQFIRDLSAETRSQRAAAEKHLLELGPRILPYLPAPELLPSNSVRDAVRRIRGELERREARESVLPTRVRLTGTRPLGEVLEEIARQTDNVVDGSALPAEWLAKPVTLTGTLPTFWQAIDQIVDQVPVRYAYDATSRGLKFQAAPTIPSLVPAVAGYAGAFRIEVVAAPRTLRPVRIQAGGQQPGIARNLLRLSLRLVPEPRLRPLFLQFSARDLTVRTAARVELPALSPDASYDIALSEGASQSPIQVDYVIPDGVAVGPLELTGRMTCTAAAGHAAFRFAEIGTAEPQRNGVISRRRGGVTVSLTRVLAQPRELRVQLTVAYESGGPAFESHRTWYLHNDVFLEPVPGQQIRLNGGNETVLQGDGRLGIEYRFVELPDPLPALAFVYVAPTLIIDVPLEFTIESVPLTGRPGGENGQK